MVQISVCDRSNDCGDATDEINCLKNSVITAAIMGSLICGLLLVIAISCTCKLIALRNVEQQQLSESQIEGRGGSSHSSYSRSFPFAFGESDTPLFRLEQEFFYREPPPSYAAAMGGSAGSSGVETPYERDRQSRRQRRVRRHRRRPPSPPPLPEDEASDLNLASQSIAVTMGSHSVSSHANANHHHQHNHHPSSTHRIVDSSNPDTDSLVALDKVLTFESPKGTSPSSASENLHHHHHHHQSPQDGTCPANSSCTTNTTSTSCSSSTADTTNNSSSGVSIELDSIPSPSQIDCDEEPLLS